MRSDYSKGGGESGPRVLMVDDEAVVTMVNGRMLETLGYRVTALTDSREALRIVEENGSAFDVLVTDQAMPDVTGLELATRSHARNPDLPAIITTGFKADITPERMERAGVREILMKPFDARELAEVIDRVLGRS